jgi:hypothetical protein
VDRSGETKHAPGFEGRLLALSIERFVALSRDDPRAVISELERQAFTDDSPHDPYRPLDLPWHFDVPNQQLIKDRWIAVEALTDWIALNEQGARDLKCPRNEVVPDFRGGGRVATIALAEGCGQRASYTRGTTSHAFDLIAIVPVSPKTR